MKGLRILAVLPLIFLSANLRLLAVDCNTVTVSSPLQDRLDCTLTRKQKDDQHPKENAMLGSFLKAIKDDVVMEGYVVPMSKTPAINSATTSFGTATFYEDQLAHRRTTFSRLVTTMRT